MKLHKANEGMWRQGLNRRMKVERRCTVTRCRWNASHVYITYDTRPLRERGQNKAIIDRYGKSGACFFDCVISNWTVNIEVFASKFSHNEGDEIRKCSQTNSCHSFKSLNDWMSLVKIPTLFNRKGVKQRKYYPALTLLLSNDNSNFFSFIAIYQFFLCCKNHLLCRHVGLSLKRDSLRGRFWNTPNEWSLVDSLS